MENKIQLQIVGLSYSQTQTGAYALVLGEKHGKRRLPIIIGNFEAQAIAIELEQMKPSRPLTHDVFKTVAQTFDIAIKEVVIYNLVEGIFFAKLICDNGIKIEEIDARSSDAIALAVRFNCPIYTHEFILSQAGLVMENEDENSEESEEVDVQKAADTGLSGLSIEELNKKLDEAIGDEDYELASHIRDEINRRS